MIKRLFENKNELEYKLCKEIQSKINYHSLKKESVSLLLSGGSTPKGLYEKLAKSKINWNKLKIGLVDDRMVENDSQYSNAKMIKDIFESEQKDNSFCFTPLVHDYKNHDNNTLLIKDSLDDFTNPDIVLLGMGTDGHFASLFPNDENSIQGLSESNPCAICYTNAPSHPAQRISFTWPIIKRAKN